jgi:hypothetical protein
MSTDVRTLYWAVVVDDGTVDNGLDADVTLGIGESSGTATVTCDGVPSGAAPGVALQVYAGWTGSPDILFRGEIVDIVYSTDGTVKLVGQDLLSRLAFKWTRDERVYINDGGLNLATDTDTAQNLVEASGIDSSDTSIEGADLPIGVTVPFTLQNGDVPLEAIRKLDEATLYVTFTRANGAIYRRPIATGSSAHSYTANDILVGTRTKSKTGIINSVKVIGQSYQGVPTESLAQATSSYIPDPPKYITEEINDYVIQTQTPADDLAAAALSLRNHLQDTFEITVAGDGTVNPAETITITCSRLGLSSATRFVRGVRHHVSAADFTTVISGEALS